MPHPINSLATRGRSIDVRGARRNPRPYRDHHGFLIYSFLACTNLFSEYLTTYLANIWPRSISGVSVEPATSEILRKLHRVLRWLAADRSARARGAARKTLPVQRRT